jgi:hypothetical protein
MYCSPDFICRIYGQWTCLHRAMDPTGKTVDFSLSAKPITPDGPRGLTSSVREMKADGLLRKYTTLRSSKYLNKGSSKTIETSSPG